jgi:predicted permease
MFDLLVKDLKYSIRKLIKSPSFTTTAVLSLALGIAGNVLIFSLINTFMFTPLASVKDPKQVVWVYSSESDRPAYLSSNYPDYLAFRDQNDVFSGLSAYDGVELSLNTGGEPEIVHGAAVTANLFSTLGVDSFAGRRFLPDEDKPQGTSPAAMLGYNFWQRRFGNDAGIIGKPIELNGIGFTIVGITPPGFTGAQGVTMPDLWVPISMYSQLYPPLTKARDRLNDRNTHWLNLVGRLKPGISAEQAEAALSIIAARLAQEFPETNKNWGVKVASMGGGKLDPRERGDMLPVAGLLLAVVGLVLLIACANVANLMLMRSSLRQKAMAICLALGATRIQLMRQLLMETVILFMAGGVVGLLAALGALNVLRSVVASDRPLAVEFTLDWRVLGFTLLVSLLTALVFGLAPALRASRPNLVAALKNEEYVENRGFRRSRLRSLFVVSQVTLSLVLLIVAGLLIRSLLNTQGIDPGFNPENALVVPLDLKLQRYNEARGKEFQRQVVERVSMMPGVQMVGLVRDLPLGNSSGNLVMQLQGGEAAGHLYMVSANLVGPGYFRAMGIPINRGREFTEQDREGAPGVVIINETMARRFWSSQNPLGQRISIDGKAGPFMEIVGVARDSKYKSLEEGPTAFVYQALPQSNYQSRLNIVVRTTDDPQKMLGTVRNQVRQMDSKLPLVDVQTMAQQVNLALLPAKAAAWFLGLFGILALVLAAIGLYGVVAHSVSRRTHEIGIRMTLGARPRDVLFMILREGMSLVLIAIIVGLLLAFAATRLLSGFIYGISSTDPLTFGGVALLLALVALIASYLPARHATTVEPNVALRQQ